jgi:hypothetical protein
VSAEQRAAFKAERHAKMAARQAERAAKLRAELKLTAQQEPAFAAFLAAGKPVHRAPGLMASAPSWPPCPRRSACSSASSARSSAPPAWKRAWRP